MDISLKIPGVKTGSEKMNKLRNRRKLISQIIVGVLLIILWQLTHFALPVIPTPLQTLLTLRIQITDGVLVDALINATLVIFVGFFLASITGIVIGLLMGSNTLIEDFGDPYVNALYATPLSAIVPALVIWFGTGFTVRVVAVFAMAIFPVIVNTLEGMHSVPADLINVAKSFGGGSKFIIPNVIIPYEVPYIMAGLRIGMARSVKGLVIAELIISITGLGGIIHSYSSAINMSGVLSVVLVLMVMGMVFTSLIAWVGDLLIAWDTSEV